MRKGISILLSLSMLAALAGCGASQSASQAASEAAAAASTAAQEISAGAESAANAAAQEAASLAVQASEAVADTAEKAAEAANTAADAVKDAASETAAGGQDSAESDVEMPEVLRIGVPMAPPALAVLRMADSHALGEDVEIEVEVWTQPEQVIAMVQDGEHDMFGMPLTVASKLSNKGIDLRLMNVNTWGVTYFITTDPDFQDWSDLKGKTVYCPNQSSPVDALTQYFLKEAGLTPGEDVEIIYSTGAEIAQLMINGGAQYASILEPQATNARMKNENVRVAFSFEDEYKRINGDDNIILPNAGFATTQRFIDAHPGVEEKVNAAYAEALAWCLEHPEETGKLAEAGLGLNPNVVAKALPNMGLLFKTGGEAKAEVENFYQILVDFDASMIGGKLPDAALYLAE